MTQTSRPPNGVLTSWKEIAGHFNREVRTVQLWEKEEGLPVHRHLHRRQSSVYAYPEELEKWRKERGSVAPSEALLEATAEEKPADGETRAADTGEVSAPGLPAAMPPAPTKWGKWVAGVAALAAVTVTLWMGWQARPHSSSRSVANAEIMAFRNTAAGNEPHDFRLGDFNGDGRDDLVYVVGPNYFELRLRFSPPGFIAIADLGSDVVIHGPGNGTLSPASADLNGDGIPDLIVSETLHEPNYTRTGDTYIIWGRRRWPATLRLADDADVVVRMDSTDDTRLSPCSPFGHRTDVTGDGIDDLLLSAPEYTEAGRRSAGAVFVVSGRRAWPQTLEVLAEADVRIIGARIGEGLGGPCDVGDFNGDGRADLAAFASEGTLWMMRGLRGRTYVFYGRETWPRLLDTATEFDLRVDAEHPTPGGITINFADVNGDSRSDLVMLHSTSQNAPTGCEVAVWFGGTAQRGEVKESSADVLMAAIGPHSEWATPLNTSDLDFDGIADLLISAPASGEVKLVYGRRQWESRGSLEEFGAMTLYRGARGAGFGHVNVGDADGDLLPDLLLWARADLPAARQASAWLVKLHQPVVLDVRPTHEPNILFLPEGLLVARVKGVSRPVSESLELSSVRLAGAAPVEQVENDYDGDGVADLQLYFETATLRVTPETTRVVMTARTREGYPAGATDSVQVVMKRAAGSPPANTRPVVPGS